MCRAIPGPQERTGCTLGEPLALHLEELQTVTGPALGGNGSDGSVLSWMLSERAPHTHSHKRTHQAYISKQADTRTPSLGCTAPAQPDPCDLRVPSLAGGQ